METSANLPLVPEHNDFESQAGIREAGKKIHSYLLGLRRKLEEVFSHVANDVNPLYGELDYSAAAPASGAQSVISVTVPGAILGYRAEPTYDKDLQGMAMTAYVSGNDTVQIVFRNGTAGAVTLAAGRFRVYVWPRILST